MHPFVFLPGTLCDDRLWHHQVGIAKDRFIVNLRTQDHLDAMLSAISAAPYESFILVGFSMGGYLAQEFALKHPERVKKLVVIGSSCEGYPPREKEIILKALPMIERGLFKGLTEKRLRDFLHPKSYEDARIRALVHSMAGEDAGEVYLRQLKATLDRRSLASEVGKIRCPFHVIAGKEDQIVPIESVLRFETYAPRVEIDVLPECGHFVPLEKPERVNEILTHIAG